MEPYVDDIVEHLRAVVDQRRTTGEYPIGMETELDAEFASIVSATKRHELDGDEIGRRLEALRGAVRNVSGVAETGSRVPGGSALHGSIGRLIERHTNHVAHGVREVGDAVVSALTEIERLLRVQRAADERQLNDVLAGVLDRLAAVDELMSSVRSIERRLAQLESQQPEQ